MERARRLFELNAQKRTVEEEEENSRRDYLKELFEVQSKKRKSLLASIDHEMNQLEADLNKLL